MDDASLRDMEVANRSNSPRAASILTKVFVEHTPVFSSRASVAIPTSERLDSSSMVILLFSLVALIYFEICCKTSNGVLSTFSPITDRS